jgi:hypothetical protein
MSRIPQSVRQLLDSKPVLRRLEREIEAQADLLSEIRRLLPADLAPHCGAARMHGDRLVIHVDSPVWATRLRYLAPQIVSLLQAQHPDLREIKSKVLISRQNHRPHHPRTARRSPIAADVVDSSATDIGDAHLRAALQRLARTLRR